MGFVLIGGIIFAFLNEIVTPLGLSEQLHVAVQALADLLIAITNALGI
jgi:hypothetical protein